jgi:hypothetical protein
MEDARDIEALRKVEARVASAESEYVPIEMAMRLIEGESPVKVWREHRKMTARQLAGKAKVSPSYLSEIEAKKKPGSLDAMARIARALKISLDDLAALKSGQE